MKVKILLLLALLPFNIVAFEINTHQAITVCALSIKCLGIKEQQGAENLNYFALTMQLNHIDYGTQIFKKYIPERSYFEYAEAGEGLGENDKDDDKLGKQIAFTGGKTYLKNAIDKNGNITNLLDYSRTSYISLIEAGSILEDALFPDADRVRGGDGRFNNHFYSAQFNYLPKETGSFGKANTLIYPIRELPIIFRENQLRQSNRASLSDGIFDAYGKRTDNISWALDESVAFANRVNDYNLPNAFKYYRKSFEGTKDEREKNQAKLFISLGHIIHLLEDLHSPAHVRNGSHPGGDYLEIFARHTGGFFLRNGRFSSYDNNAEITEAVRNIDINDIMLDKNDYDSYQSFMVGEALWVSNNFFSEAHSIISYMSEDHIYTHTDNINSPDVNLRADRCGVKNTTIFDIEKRNPLLAKSNTIISDKSFLRTSFDSILTNGNASPQIIGDISYETVVAFEERKASSLFGTKCRTLAAPYNYTTASLYYDYNKRALLDTAKNVIPRAVASVQAFTNFFFRGRMEANINYDDANGARIIDSISIKNTSDPLLVSSEGLLTFKVGSKLKISYLKKDDPKEEIIPLKTVILPIDLFVNEKFEIKDLKDLFVSEGIDIIAGDKVLVLLDGQIGEVPAVDDYNLGATGLAVAYATSPDVLIKKTGQSYAYAQFDDGHYKKGVNPSYLKTELEPIPLVRDGVTKLSWHDPTEIIKMTLVNAIFYCDGLNPTGVEADLDAKSKWRLPTVKELLSLSDVRHYAEPIFRHTTQFVHYRSNRFDKSVIYNNNNYLPPFFGVTNGDNSSSEISTRCVKGKKIVDSNLSRDDKTGVVSDRSTGLKWQDNIQYSTALVPMIWEDALNYCESLDLGDSTDWRMPNFNELYSIVDVDGISEFQNNTSSSLFLISSSANSNITRYSVSGEGTTSKEKLTPYAHPGQQGFSPWTGYTRCVR